jgi:hypothetical protein
MLNVLKYSNHCIFGVNALPFDQLYHMNNFKIFVVFIFIIGKSDDKTEQEEAASKNIKMKAEKRPPTAKSACDNNEPVGKKTKIEGEDKAKKPAAPGENAKEANVKVSFELVIYQNDIYKTK